MTSEVLELRLEEWAQWVQGGAAPALLGYGRISPGFKAHGTSSQGVLICTDRQADVESAVARLQVQGHGAWDDLRNKWISKPVKRYELCAEVLRAEYRAHPMYGDARYESPGNNRPKTLKRLGISERTYWLKLKLAKAYIGQCILATQFHS